MSCTKCSLPQIIENNINLISTLVICLKIVFIKMLDKLIASFFNHTGLKLHIIDFALADI